jgi:hypothetical protein
MAIIRSMTAARSPNQKWLLFKRRWSPRDNEQLDKNLDSLCESIQTIEKNHKYENINLRSLTMSLGYIKLFR